MHAVRQSFDRAKRHGFAERFYDVFLATDPAIRAKFHRTDFERQRELLLHGVYSMLDYAEHKAMGKLALERLARLHRPERLGVEPWMYERWLECFLATLAEVDPEMSAALALAWREALTPSIAFMVEASGAARSAGRRA
jgi:hemoglobin-like flavoprotein